jgi:hypothetical protein
MVPSKWSKGSGPAFRRIRTVETTSPSSQEIPVDVLDFARWQFGIITVYHFLFVPITIGLSAIIAG